MSRGINFNQMQMFVEVARRGSLTEAAYFYKLTLPAITRKMHRVERELGVQLFERGERNQATLTYKGQQFLGFVERTLASYYVLQESWRYQPEPVTNQTNFK